ncbi:MAG: DUF4281 domain-containing protein [Betaproteobacteria bacterium]|nr:DUF4281 domain-containing protein [Betaproteobacteria bacterium]
MSGSLALAGWIALAAVPLRFRIARPVALAVALVLTALYIALILSYWSSGTGDFQSLAGVARLFEHPGLLLAGWIHYLAFDLLVGTWEREEARRIGLAQWVLVPCLVLTFLFGPLGWAAFLACRTVRLDSRHDTAAVRP